MTEARKAINMEPPTIEGEVTIIASDPYTLTTTRVMRKRGHGVYYELRMLGPGGDVTMSFNPREWVQLRQAMDAVTDVSSGHA